MTQSLFVLSSSFFLKALHLINAKSVPDSHIPVTLELFVHNFFNIAQKHPQAWHCLLYNRLISLLLNITVVENWKMEEERDVTHQWHANIHLPQKKKKIYYD